MSSLGVEAKYFWVAWTQIPEQGPRMATGPRKEGRPDAEAEGAGQSSSQVLWLQLGGPPSLDLAGSSGLSSGRRRGRVLSCAPHTGS